MVAKITLWANATIMVFDDKGEQVPELQGHFRDKLAKALAQADVNTEYAIGSWHHGTLPCSRVQLEQFLLER